jgi:hypothetical protein
MSPDPEQEPNGPPRPTPVRVLMEADEAAESQAAAERPARTFQVEDEQWLVRAAGFGRSGSGQDSGAPLLLLRLRRVAGEEVDEREALVVARTMDELSDEELGRAVSTSRPARSTDS